MGGEGTWDISNRASNKNIFSVLHPVFFVPEGGQGWSVEERAEVSGRGTGGEDRFPVGMIPGTQHREGLGYWCRSFVRNVFPEKCYEAPAV